MFRDGGPDVWQMLKYRRGKSTGHYVPRGGYHFLGPSPARRRRGSYGFWKLHRSWPIFGGHDREPLDAFLKHPKAIGAPPWQGVSGVPGRLPCTTKYQKCSTAHGAHATQFQMLYSLAHIGAMWCSKLRGVAVSNSSLCRCNLENPRVKDSTSGKSFLQQWPRLDAGRLWTHGPTKRRIMQYGNM